MFFSSSKTPIKWHTLRSRCIDLSDGTARERVPGQESESGERETVYLWWNRWVSTFSAGPGCSGGWSGAAWELVRLGKVLTWGLLSLHAVTGVTSGCDVRMWRQAVTSACDVLSGSHNRECGAATGITCKSERMWYATNMIHTPWAYRSRFTSRDCIMISLTLFKSRISGWIFWLNISAIDDNIARYEFHK